MPNKLKTKELAKPINRSIGSDFFIDGCLTLNDGRVFNGQMPGGHAEFTSGEVVFSTGMTGYVESITDPSYAGQILVFTYPLIGNYGVQLEAAESKDIQVNAIVMSALSGHFSHQQADLSLQEWLSAKGIPMLTGVDTRALTKHLRSRGTMAGAIAGERVRKNTILLQKKFVSIAKPKIYNCGAFKKVILVDCGTKENIVRSLLDLKVQVKQVPFDYDYSSEEYDGVLISNGPGDPTDYKQTVTTARKAMAKDKPVFGICLGSQIMALAAGAKTYKLKFGHRGHNQPCLETGSGRGYITSQNHGYAINENTLPKEWRVTFRNLNDSSVEGIEHKAKPFFSVQFHPEACPGPTDTGWLFEKFYKQL